MKKLFIFILIMSLICPVFALSEIDVASMSDNELKEMISLCSDELRNRAKTPDEWILIFEYESIKIYQIGEATIGSKKIISIPVAIINDMDFDVYISTNYELCNGWEISGWGYGVMANAKKKTELHFFADDAFIEELEDVKSLRFAWCVKNDSTNEYILRQKEAEEYSYLLASKN